MNTLELAELMERATARFDVDDRDRWEALMLSAGYHASCAALNALSLLGRTPTADDLRSALPDEHRLSDSEREAGLRRVEELRARWRATREGTQ